MTRAIWIAFAMCCTCCSVFRRGDATGSVNGSRPNEPSPDPVRSGDGASAELRGELEQSLIFPGRTSRMDGIEMGIGRNDGVTRLYCPESADGKGHELTYDDGSWVAGSTYTGAGVHCTPRLGDLDGRGTALFIGSWNDVGVGVVSHRGGWGTPTIIPGSSGLGRILSLKIGPGRNDGVDRLYVGSDRGLIEYGRKGDGYDRVLVLDHAVGHFGLGDGRNDGVPRLYAGEREGSRLHELTWNGKSYVDEVIFECSESSEYTAHVGDGRGDGVHRVYAWCGKLYELTYTRGSWSQTIVDEKSAPRFYITSGRVRSDNRSRLYVSQKSSGLMEYTWNGSAKAFQVDVVTGATGGAAIGDGRRDGKNRLYVAGGSKSAYTKSAAVEVSSSNPPSASP